MRLHSIDRGTLEPEHRHTPPTGRVDTRHPSPPFTHEMHDDTAVPTQRASSRRGKENMPPGASNQNTNRAVKQITLDTSSRHIRPKQKCYKKRNPPRTNLGHNNTRLASYTKQPPEPGDTSLPSLEPREERILPREREHEIPRTKSRPKRKCPFGPRTTRGILKNKKSHHDTENYDKEGNPSPPSPQEVASPRNMSLIKYGSGTCRIHALGQVSLTHPHTFSTKESAHLPQCTPTTRKS